MTAKMRFSAVSVATGLVAALFLVPSVSLADNFHAGTSRLISKLPTGAPADGGHPSISADGRYVAFESIRRLTTDDTDETYDVYRYDALNDQTILVSPTVSGVPHDSDQFMPSISADGNKIAYISGWVTNNVFISTTEPEVLGSYSIMRDVNAGTSRTLSVPGYSVEATKISGNGAWATVAIDTEGSVSVIVVNTGTGAWKAIGRQCSGCGVAEPSPLSYDGRFVAYEAGSQVHRHDRDADGNGVFDEPGKISTILVSVLPDGSSPGGFYPTISNDGSRVGFLGGNWVRDNDNVGMGISPLGFGIYVRDIGTNTTTLASSNSLGVSSGIVVGARSSISGDGRFIGFSSPDPYLAPGDLNAGWDVFLKEIDTGKTSLVTTGYPESELEGCELTTFRDQAFRCRYDRMEPAVSANASFVAYQSAFDLGKSLRRVFLRDRSGGCGIVCLD